LRERRPAPVVLATLYRREARREAPAPREIAAPLGITPGVLILVNTGTEYLPGETPIQVNTMSYRVDRVRFQFAAGYAATS
jgi:DNA-binding GntR family transcriptional regulator